MKNATSRASLSFVRRFNGNAKSQLKSEYDAVIIGGGHNGLVAAACLARRGASVCVLERRYLVGGAAVTEQLVPGFRFSRASYLLGLFRPRILSDLRLKEHGLKLFLRDPSSYTPLREEFWKSSDAKSLTLGRDEKKNYQEIAKFSKKDAEAFGRYEAQMGRIAAALDPLWDVSVDRLLRPLGQPSRWATARALWACREELATVVRSASALGGDVRPLWELMTSSPRRVLGRWFESEPLLATLATDALIGTMAHTGTPGIGYVLLHHVMGCVEGVRGAWAYPEGGMGAVSEAIARAAKSHGAEIYTDQLVTDVLVDEVGAAHGVSTSEGSHVRARVVLSNATPTATLAMLPPEAVGEREAAAYAAIDYESPVTKINVALSRLPDFAADPCSVANRPLPLHQATIHLNCDNCDVVDRAYLDARRGVLPQRPMIEMVVPSSLDRTLAPPGAHVCLLFTQFTPYTLAGGRVWDEQTKQEYAEMVFNCIEEYAPGFKSSVVEKEVLAPPDLEQIFGLTGGNIFHGALRGPQLLTGRPTSEGAACPRTPVERLLLCGAGAHPGGGVTGAPGLIAAEHAARTLGLASP